MKDIDSSSIDDLEMGGDNMNDNMGSDEDSSQFDTNFDAGVDADETSDPKKFIQQLTGKLSQTLRNYNQNQNDPDLNKYVAGMISVQAANGLDDNDKEEIIDKIQNGSPDNNSNDDMNNGMDDNMDNRMDNQNDEMPQPQPMENKKSKKKIIEKRLIDEILNDILIQKDDGEQHSIEYRDKPKIKSIRQKPFINPLMN